MLARVNTSAWRPGITLLAGLAIGWGLANTQLAAPLRADRAAAEADDAVATGPVTIQHDRGNDIQVEHDALYYLDYKGGRLLAAVPSYQQTIGRTRIIDGWSERDLVADFKIAPGSAQPKFLMTTGTMGGVNGAWAPLYVFESTTHQAAIYRVTSQTIGTVTTPKFELLEVVSLAHKPQAQTAR
jgi:hypothetical protein